MRRRWGCGARLRGWRTGTFGWIMWMEMERVTVRVVVVVVVVLPSSRLGSRMLGAIMVAIATTMGEVGSLVV